MQVSQKGRKKKEEREKERGKGGGGGHVVCPTMLQLNNIINSHIIVLNALLTGLGLGYDYFQNLGLGLPPLEMCAKHFNFRILFLLGYLILWFMGEQ